MFRAAFRSGTLDTGGNAALVALGSGWSLLTASRNETKASTLVGSIK